MADIVGTTVASRWQADGGPTSASRRWADVGKPTVGNGNVPPKSTSQSMTINVLVLFRRLGFTSYGGVAGVSSVCVCVCGGGGGGGAIFMNY